MHIKGISMKRTHTCGELTAKHAGKEVVLQGWIASKRGHGKISFIDLRDRTGIVQVFYPAHLDAVDESVIEVHGLVKKRPTANKNIATGEIEVEAKKIEILSKSEAPLPIEIKDPTTTHIDKRLDYRFLDVRRDSVKNIFKIRSKVFQSSVNFFDQNGFVAINTPKLTESGVESGAEEFGIPYFGKVAKLAQSPQIYKQMFVVSGLERVYEIAPVFRAEKSETTRHQTEFVGIDFEMGFIENENDVMDVVENYIKYLLTEIKENCKEELKALNVEIDIPKKIPRITLPEAIKILKEKGKTVPKDDDLDPEGERIMGEWAKEKHHSDFVFMLEYPWKKRPFYHMRPDGNPNTTKSFDLLYKGVEIGTGAQREHRLEVLEKQAKEKGIDLKKMQFYRDIFRFGAPAHGGIGLGLDRIVMRMLNLPNIREAILLPRDPVRLSP